MVTAKMKAVHTGVVQYKHVVQSALRVQFSSTLSACSPPRVARRPLHSPRGPCILWGRFWGVMEGTPGDSQYEYQFLDDSESQLFARRELGCGLQATRTQVLSRPSRRRALRLCSRPLRRPSLRHSFRPRRWARLQARHESPRVWSTCLCRSERRQLTA
jgi:hypothetical protein